MPEYEKDALYRPEAKKSDSYRSGDDQAYHVDFVRRFFR